MVDTDANSVFPQTIFSGSSDLPLNNVCAMYFVPDWGLKMGMRKVGCWDCAYTACGREALQDTRRLNQQHSHEFSLLQHNRRGKMCKHKHALKGKMIRGVQKRSSPDPRLVQVQLFLSTGKQSPLFISHMARPPVLLTQEREMLRKLCKDMSRRSVWER